jgi:hypothetical protein
LCLHASCLLFTVQPVPLRTFFYLLPVTIMYWWRRGA